MKPWTDTTPSWLLVLVSAGCVAEPRVFTPPVHDGPATIVLVRDGMIERRFDLAPGESSIGIPHDPEASLYLVRVSPARVLEAHAGVAVDRLDELNFTQASPELATCSDGVFEGHGREAWMTVGLRGLAEVGLIEGAEIQGVDSFPAALDQLAIHAPFESCLHVEAQVQPFAAESPFLEAGDTIGLLTVTQEFLGYTDVGYVGYAGDDHALIGMLRGILLIGRGETLGEAEYIDLVDQDRPLLEVPGIDATFGRIVKRPGTSPDGAVTFVVMLVHGGPDAVVDEGFSVFDLTVRDGRFEGYRLLHRALEGRALAGALAAGPAGEFAVALQGNVLYGDATGTRLLSTEADSMVMGLAISEGARPKLVAGMRPIGWYESTADPVDQLVHRPAPRSAATHDSCDRVVWLGEANGTRLISGCSLPAVFEREQDGWIERPMWLSEALTTCTAAEPRCGRAQANLRAGVEEMASAPGGEIAYLMRGCAALLVDRTESGRCARHVEIDVTRYRNEQKDDIRLRRLDRRGHRLLVGGDGGLLVEIELEAD